MGDSGVNTEVPNPEASKGVSQKIKKGLVRAALPGLFAAGTLLGAACAPDNNVASTSDQPTNPGKTQIVPPSPTSELGTLIYPIDKNVESLKDDLGLEKGGGSSTYEFLTDGVGNPAVILVTKGEYGFNNEEQVRAIKEAMARLNQIDPKIMEKLTRLGLRAIAPNIKGYGPAGFFGQSPQEDFRYSFVKGVMLVNPDMETEEENRFRNQTSIIGATLEEPYGMSVWRLLKYTRDGYIIPLEDLSKEDDFKPEKRLIMMEFFKKWFKENEHNLSFLKMYPALKSTLESQDVDELFQDIRITKALAAQAFFKEEYYKQGKITDEEYEEFNSIFFYSFRQTLIDHFKKTQKVGK